MYSFLCVSGNQHASYFVHIYSVYPIKAYIVGGHVVALLGVETRVWNRTKIKVFRTNLIMLKLLHNFGRRVRRKEERKKKNGPLKVISIIREIGNVCNHNKLFYYELLFWATLVFF